MSGDSLRISFDGIPADEVGLHVQALRGHILDRFPEEVEVRLEKSNPNSQQFFETLFIDGTAALLAHGVLKVIEHYHRERRQVTIRIEHGSLVAVLSGESDDVDAELAKLREGMLESK